MDRLFDENNEFEGSYYRTIWYGYIDSPLDKALAETIASDVKADLATPIKDTPIATHWIFYGADKSKDALGEEVRNSLMIRFRDGKYLVNFNLSDLSFVIALDMVNDFTDMLKALLTGN